MLIIERIRKISFSQWLQIVIVVLTLGLSLLSTLLDVVLITLVSFGATCLRVSNRLSKYADKQICLGAIICALSVGASWLNATEAGARKERERIVILLADSDITYESDSKWIILKVPSACDDAIGGVLASFERSEAQFPMTKWKKETVEKEPVGSGGWSWWYVKLDDLLASVRMPATTVKMKILDHDGQILKLREDDLIAIAKEVFDWATREISPSGAAAQADWQLFAKIVDWCDDKDSEQIRFTWAILQQRTPIVVVVLDHDDSGAHRCQILRSGIPTPPNKSGKGRTGK
jgi:hypothetical protein